MKVKFDFDLDIWMSGIEIEADSFEEAKNKLLKMDVQEIIEEGYVESSTVKDIESEVLERTIKVRAYDIKYDLYDSDFEENGVDPEDELAKERFIDSLPHELTLEVSDVDTRSSYEELAIADAISDETGWLVDNFKYDIISEK